MKSLKGFVSGFITAAVLTAGPVFAVLTDLEYQKHVTALCLIQARREPTPLLVTAAIRYGRRGTDEREAAVRFLREVFSMETGLLGAIPSPLPVTLPVAPVFTTTQRHQFKHWVDMIENGEGFES